MASFSSHPQPYIRTGIRVIRGKMKKAGPVPARIFPRISRISRMASSPSHPQPYIRTGSAQSVVK